jgi:LysR family hydrogen peroxide-inducible transcriptional activator
MTIQQMTYLVALDNYRHFVRAAESCMVTQPTLSMQVQKLEEEIGAILIDRSVSPLVPTPIGMEVIASARRILQELDALKVLVNDQVDSVQGQFTLGVIPTIAPYLLPLWLPQFVEDNVDIELNIQELRTEEIMTQLKKGTLDMGILATPLEDDQIKEIPLYYESFKLWINTNDPLYRKTTIRIEDLNPNEMLLLDEGHCFRSQALSLCAQRRKNKKGKLNYQSGSLETLMAMVEKGLGYTLVPEMAVLAKSKQKLIRSFNIPEPVREISLVSHQRFSRKGVLEYLQKGIQQSLPNHFVQPRKYKRIGWI